MKSKKLWQPINLADLFLTSSERYANKEALKYRQGHHYERLTYFELKEEVFKLAARLRQIGLGEKDRVILFTENRPEWVVTDLALIILGVVNVPIHSVLSAKQLGEIIEEIRPKALFFADEALGTKLLEISDKIAKIPHLISFEKLMGKDFKKMIYFKDLVTGWPVEEETKAEIIEKGLQVKPQDVATIIYTSGTTGHFKGVRLTHENLICDITAVLKSVEVYPEDKFFSILPLSHVFERTVGYYVPIYAGASIGYAIDMTKVSQEIQERKPTIIIAVPRLFEKIYEKIMAKARANLAIKALFYLAFYYQKKGRHQFLKKVFDRLVFAKIRNNFGGEVRFFVSGGAALPEKIGKFFESVGLVVLEGYGLTETAPVLTCNRLENYAFGTVGQALEGISLKISAGGEVLAKGKNVFPGYIRDKDTKEAFTADGWFKTGDYGYFDKKNFLVLTGRKKDLIVLSTGKKVAPAPLEAKLELSPYIDQAFVFGDARKHIGAIIVPNFEELAGQFPDKTKKALATDRRVYNFLTKEIAEILIHEASYEKIRKFIIQKEPFSVESGELTPKFSLRRHVIYDRNLTEIEKIYQIS